MFGLNFNPFESAHGGETDEEGNLTARGKQDFFASFTDFSESEKNWKKFLSGDISWKDFVDPGSVIANPAQKIADPGEFYTGNKLTEGDFGKRGVASAIVAALAYGAGALIAGGAAAEGGAAAGSAAGGEAGAGGAASVGTLEAGSSGTAVAAGGEAGSGGASVGAVEEGGFSWESLMDTFQQYGSGLPSNSYQQQNSPVIRSNSNTFKTLSDNLALKKLDSISKKKSKLTDMSLINPFKY